MTAHNPVLDKTRTLRYAAEGRHSAHFHQVDSGAVRDLYQTLEPAEMTRVLNGAYRVREVDSTYGAFSG